MPLEQRKSGKVLNRGSSKAESSKEEAGTVLKSEAPVSPKNLQDMIL